MHAESSVCLAAAQQASAASGVVITCSGFAAFSPRLCAARFVLPNGLRIVLAQLGVAPIFAYQTWFGVGSRDEDPKRTGLAHLFEHLMFKGTHQHPAGVFDRQMEARGAQTNAATWVDWTYYTQALAARGDNLRTLVGFEADRLHNLALDEATFRSELEVVKNERRMSVEDSVTGQLAEHLMATAYTQHPYRWPTIGSMDHLAATSLQEAVAFYRRHYAAANATVVVVGDVPWVDTLTELARGYGPLPSQPMARAQLAAEPPQTAARQVRLTLPTATVQMMVGYRAVGQADPRYSGLEMLAEILAGGDTARLYQRLVVREQVASEIAGSVQPFAHPGLFEFYLALRPTADAAAVLVMLQDELQRLGDGISQAELEKARHGLQFAHLESLADVESCAEALGHYEANYGDFAGAWRQAEAYDGWDTTRLMALAKTIFVSHSRTSVVAHPQGAA